MLKSQSKKEGSWWELSTEGRGNGRKKTSEKPKEKSDELHSGPKLRVALTSREEDIGKRAFSKLGKEGRR